MLTTPPPLLPAELPDAAAEQIEVFRVEADEHLRSMSGLLVAARKEPADRWQQVRRSAHTLKGSAALVGLNEVTALAHRMEDLLGLCFEGERVETPDEVDLLLSATDAIDDVVNGRPSQTGFTSLFGRLDAALALSQADKPTAEIVSPTLPTPAEPTAPASPAVPARAVEVSVRVPVSKLDELGKLIGELVIARTSFERRSADFARLLTEMEPSTTRLRKSSAKLEVGFEAAALAGGKAGRTTEGFDDLELDRHTEFHLISRDLAEATADVQTLGGELGHLRSDLDGLLTRQARLTSEVEDRLMRLRMVPLGTTVSKLQRTVRTAAQQTGTLGSVVNRAGEWPVVELAEMLGQAHIAGRRSGQVVPLEWHGLGMGLLVDKVSSTDRDVTDMQPVPRSAGRVGPFAGVLDQADDPLLVLDLDRLLSSEAIRRPT